MLTHWITDETILAYCEGILTMWNGPESHGIKEQPFKNICKRKTKNDYKFSSF